VALPALSRSCSCFWLLSLADVTLMVENASGSFCLLTMRKLTGVVSCADSETKEASSKLRSSSRCMGGKATVTNVNCMLYLGVTALVEGREENTRCEKMNCVPAAKKICMNQERYTCEPELCDILQTQQHENSQTMRTVKNILDSKQRPFNIISHDALVIDALNMLNSVNLSYLIVMDGAAYRGIFSERDYSRNVVLKGRSSSSSTVAEVMSTDLPVVNFPDSVEHCMNLMNMHKTRYLLAYDDDEQFAGVITIHDLMRAVISNPNFDPELAGRLVDQDEGGRIY
jgi:predicted transcriptional regulator